MNPQQQFLADLYVNYFNDWLTKESMAEHYGISLFCFSVMLDEGRELHERYAKEIILTSKHHENLRPIV